MSRRMWDSKAFGERLNEIRIWAGFTQEEAAAVLGVVRPTYSYYELGRTTLKVPDLKILADLFRVSVAAFFQPKGFPLKHVRPARKGINTWK